MHILLDKQDRQPLTVDLFDGGKEILDELRGETERGFIQEEELGAGHQSPGHNKHTLLASRESPGHLLLLLRVGQAGK